jgi:hypothetical protein
LVCHSSFTIAIIFTTFFINSHLHKKSYFGFMLTFALMTPYGTLASDFYQY